MRQSVCRRPGTRGRPVDPCCLQRIPTSQGVATMQRHRNRLICLVLAAVAAATLVVPAVSSARARTTVIVRDGRYGGLDQSGAMPQGASFEVHGRVVSNMHALMLMDCHNTDTGEDYARGFTIHEYPEGQAVPRSGRLEAAWTEEDSLYQGQLTSRIDFRRGMPVMTIKILVTASGGYLENCSGYLQIPLQRGG